MGPDGDDKNGMGKKLPGERVVRKTIGWLKQTGFHLEIVLWRKNHSGSRSTFKKYPFKECCC